MSTKEDFPKVIAELMKKFTEEEAISMLEGTGLIDKVYDSYDSIDNELQMKDNDSLACCFVFSDAKQGFDYWSDIATDIGSW